MNKPLVTTAVIAVAAISLSACYPWRHHHHAEVNITENGDEWAPHGDQVLTVGQTLDCPTTEGGLTRVSAASDGKSCVYQRGPDEDVTLSLVPLNGQPPRSALTPMESDLNGLVQVSTANSAVSIEANNGPGQDKAKIDMPGFHIDADGDKAKISILGMKIDADGKNAVVHTGTGGGGEATIHAGPGGAEIRAGQVGVNSANLVYILAGDHPGASGYRAVGYIARGPVAGPLVVGEFKSKTEQKGAHHDNDLQHLIDLNVKAG